MFEERASSFAKAFYDLAREENQPKEYQEALSGVLKTLNKSEELRTTLLSYALPKERLYALIDAVWGQGLKSLCPFLKTLVKNHAMGYFSEIVTAFSSLVNEGLGVEEGLAYSAIPLSQAELSRVEEAVGSVLQKKVSLDNRVEPALIGGVKVAIAGKVYDGSIARKLSELRKSLIEGGNR